MKAVLLPFMAGVMMTNLFAQTPDNLVVEGVPPFPPELQKEAARYSEFRAAAFQSWHPTRREMLITTRFAESMQLHHVKAPGAARKQITFLPEPVAGAQYQPKKGECIVFAQDAGGGEFYQLYRYDVADGRITLLTDGKSRNTGAKWSPGGQWLAYTSTKRTGTDNDVWVLEPQRPNTAKLLHQVSGGGWSVQDWSHDESKLLIAEYISINQSHLHLIDVKTGKRTEITTRGGEKVAYSNPRFAGNGKSIFVATDRGAEFQQLVEMDLNGRTLRVLTEDLNWDVDEFEVSPDGKTIAYISNEAGIGVLHLIEARSGKQ